MIPLYKLDKLPRTQKLRKIAKVFTMAEKRLSMANEPAKSAGIFTSAEMVFFASAVKMLIEDALFSFDVKKALIDVSDFFNSGDTTGDERADLRRALNIVKNILFTCVE